MPVVRAQSADEAMKVVDAIREGGVPVLEITMTVPGAVGVMEQVARRFGSDVGRWARAPSSIPRRRAPASWRGLASS